MATTNKVDDGYYLSDDGQFEIAEYDGAYRVNQLVGNRYVNVSTEKTLAAAQKKVSSLSKTTEEEAPAEEGTVVVETAPAEAAQVETTTGTLE